ncbi:aldolase [Paenibacillus hunanensis]|uniref:aldolase n=1 Tax=Paenibacillus hunanensis TaxID=539262 RepID=UPI002A6A3B3B|nr:aldolase [Paenibacillus hunanensis]WPP40624.1 aldolase [Paenibacillus hunanensis]
MMNTIQQTVYEAFGLAIQSEIPLPELPPVSHAGKNVDVTVRLASLSRWDAIVSSRDTNFSNQTEGFVFRMPDTATFCVQNGSTITIDPLPGVSTEKLRLFVLGTCMGVLLMQRGLFPLHGSALSIDGRAYAFVGQSGAGKSTLAASFLQSGYSLISDDVIAISYENGVPLVYPAYPQQKLWQESLDHFGQSSSGYSALHDEYDKFAIPVGDRFHNEPIPLAGVFELVKTEEPYASIHKLERLERLHILLAHTYRSAIIPRLDLKEQHFSMVAALAGELEAYQIHRSTTAFTAPDIVERVVQLVRSEHENGA